MSRKKTHEQYVVELSIVMPTVEVIDRYIDARTNIQHKCLACEHIWSPAPTNVLRGHGCPQCAGNQKKSHEEYVSELKNINNLIIPIDMYKNADTKIKHKCLVCEYEWDIAPATILKGHGCPFCSGNKKKTHDEYVYELSMLNPDIVVNGIYVNSATEIEHMCIKCGCVWSAKPNNILNGKGCPGCKESIGEKTVCEYLMKHNILFDRQYKFDGCRNIKLLPFDFYLPKYNMCIEYDGIQHFEPREFFGGYKEFEKRQHNDLIKTEYCMKNNIKLLRIRYDQDVVYVLDELFM